MMDIYTLIWFIFKMIRVNSNSAKRVESDERVMIIILVILFWFIFSLVLGLFYLYLREEFERKSRKKGKLSQERACIVSEEFGLKPLFSM